MERERRNKMDKWNKVLEQNLCGKELTMVKAE